MNNKSENIKYLWYSPNRKQLLRLFGVLKFYGIQTNKIYPMLNKFVKKRMTDFEIMAHIRRMILSADKPPDTPQVRGSKRADDIIMLLVKSRLMPFEIVNGGVMGNYLDIGASDGLITKAVSNILGLDKKSTYAVDIDRWMGQENKLDENVNVQFLYINPKEKKKCIPFKDSKFDFITVFQALHHFENLPQMMAEIQRLCRPNGVVVIREHNVNSKYVKALTDLEHMFYGILTGGLKMDDFASDYYGEYKSITEWDCIFAKYGFKCVLTHEKKNPTQYYYGVYVNVGIKNTE